MRLHYEPIVVTYIYEIAAAVLSIVTTILLRLFDQLLMYLIRQSYWILIIETRQNKSKKLI